MDFDLYIPWTRREKLREKTVEEEPTSIEVIKQIIMKALAPFPEAREALSVALLKLAGIEYDPCAT